MARMPQIPGVEYSGQPGAQVERAPLPGADGGAEAFGQAASAIESFADNQQRAQARQEQIAEQKQKILDNVGATKAAGDYQDKVRAITAQFQEQYTDNPLDPKAKAAYRSALQQAADDTLKNPQNSEGVTSRLMEHTATINNSARASFDDWGNRRATLVAKNNFQSAVNRATKGAEDQGSLLGVTAYAQQRWKALATDAANLTEDGGKFKEKFFNEIAKAWVTSMSGGTDGRSADPAAALKALDAPKGFLVDNLTLEDRKSLRSQAETAFEGAGKQKHAQVLKEGIDQVQGAYQLFRDNKLTSGANYAMQRANEQKRLAISLDPNMDDASRSAQLKALDTQNATLRQLDIASRKQSGFGATPDEKVRHGVLKSYNALFDNADKSPEKSLTAIGEFRHDLAKAYAAGNLSRADVDRMDRGLSLALPRALVGATSALADSYTSFKWREPRLAGNAALNEYLDEKTGQFGGLKEKQKTDARLFYVEQMNDAAENGQPINAETAQAMARKAVHFVAGKKAPQ